MANVTASISGDTTTQRRMAVSRLTAAREVVGEQPRRAAYADSEPNLRNTTEWQYGVKVKRRCAVCREPSSQRASNGKLRVGNSEWPTLR